MARVKRGEIRPAINDAIEDLAILATTAELLAERFGTQKEQSRINKASTSVQETLRLFLAYIDQTEEIAGLIESRGLHRSGPKVLEQLKERRDYIDSLIKKLELEIYEKSTATATGTATAITK